MATIYLNPTGNLNKPLQVITHSTGLSTNFDRTYWGSLISLEQTSNASVLISIALVNDYDLYYPNYSFQCNTTNNALVTMTPAISGDNKINGQSTITIGKGDFVNLAYTGSTTVIQTLVLQPNNFRAYASSPITYPATPTTLVIIFDTKNSGYINTDYDNTTGIFTPKLPGKYSVKAYINISAVLATPATFLVQLLLNGTAISSSLYTTTINASGTCVVEYFGPMNGSTDNLKVQVSQTGAATQTITAGTDQSYFEGYRVSLF